MNKKERLQKDLIKVGAICFCVIAVAFSLQLYLSASLSEKERYLTKLNNETLNLKKSAADTEDKNKAAAQAVRVFETLPTNKRNLENMHEAAVRIRTARPIIDELRIKYKFAKLDVTFTRVENITPDFEVENIKIYRNTIRMKYDGLIDTMVFAFINELMEKLPGYVTIDGFLMKNNGVIDAPVFRKILSRSPELPTLVNGDINLNWWSIKEEKSKPEDEAKEAN